MIGRGGGRERDPLIRAERFPLGRLLMTPAAQECVPPNEMLRAVRRHARCDWGNLDDADRKANDRALLDDSRLLSSYTTNAGTRFWIITEADRSATTVLLPSEY